MPYAKSTIALLAGCLCASYIGGTVNFFAAAQILKKTDSMHIAIAGDNGNGMGSAFGSMAAADLVVMALYFAMLQTASRSNWLRRLFPSKCGGNGNEVPVEKDRDDESHAMESTTIESIATVSNYLPTVTATIIASSIALTSVLAASHLEQKVTNPPGTMCAFLAVLGLLFQRLIGFTLLSYKKKWIPDSKSSSSSIPSVVSLHIVNSLQKISDISPSMSNVCFYLLFAAVGTTADLSSAVAGGPMALVFASLALIVHSVTAVTVTWTGLRLGRYIRAFLKPKRRGLLLSKMTQWPSTSWEEVLTASNAAIGGPSTAAAFAAGLIPTNNADTEMEGGNNDRNQFRSALVIAATIWGVFGYAIGTGESPKTSFCTILSYVHSVNIPSHVFDVRYWGFAFKNFDAMAVVDRI